jgi:hypothetical protein
MRYYQLKLYLRLRSGLINKNLPSRVILNLMVWRNKIWDDFPTSLRLELIKHEANIIRRNQCLKS